MMKKPALYKVDKELNKSGEIQFSSPSSNNILQSSNIGSTINRSIKRKNMKDLENLSIKMDHQLMSTTNQPKTMSSLTARNNPSSTQILVVSSNFPKQSEDHSLSSSMLCTLSDNSSGTVEHASTHKEIKDKITLKIPKCADNSSLSRNKLMKIKTLPNVINYSSKVGSVSKDPAKSFIKKYLNPSQKFYASKECSKSFTDLSNPNYCGSKGKQVYESYSASRSGGTGEQNYTDQMKNQINKSFIAPNDSTGPSCIMKNTVCRPSQNIHSNRISTLTKENVKLKSDYEKLKTQMVLMEKFLEEAKLKSSEDSVKLKHYETIIQQKDLNIKKMKEQFQEERETENKIIAEYVNAENYLLELVDEFTHGMRKIYANDIEFKDVDIDGLPFCERFSNLLYNILLIIDFQKQFIVEQSKVSNQMNQNMYDNQSVIEEAENEEETDHEVNTQKHQNDENESGDEVLMRSHEHEAFQNSNLSIDYRRQSQNSKSKNYHNEEIYSYNVKKENSKNYSSELFSDEDVRNSIDHALFMKNEPLQEYIYYKDTSNLPLANTTKFLCSPSEMKINESPKISLLIQRSNKSNSYKQQDSLENLKNTDMRQSNNQNIHTFNPFAYSLQNNFMEKQILTSKDLITFPNSESSQSIKKTISENRYKNSDNNMSEESSENRMSLESIIIKRSEDKYKNSNNESTEEIFTPNFITIRSSIGNLKNLESDQSDNILSLKKNIEDKFDICLPLTSGFDSIENKVIEDYNYDYSDSIDCSEQMFSSNREDVEELKTEFVFPKAITKTN